MCPGTMKYNGCIHALRIVPSQRVDVLPAKVMISKRCVILVPEVLVVVSSLFEEVHMTSSIKHSRGVAVVVY